MIKRFFKKNICSLNKKYANKFYRFNKDELTSTLIKAGLNKGEDIFVHSSLDSFKGFQGNAYDIINSIRDCIGNNATILMPVFPDTSSQEDFLRNNKQVNLNKIIAKTGMIAEIFRRMPDIKISSHPTHPIAALGPKADLYISKHQDTKTSCGKNSPFEQMGGNKTKILLLGVDFDILTIWHYIEEKYENLIPFPLFTKKTFECELINTKGNKIIISNNAFFKETSKKRSIESIKKDLLKEGLNYSNTKIKKLNVGLIHDSNNFIECSYKLLKKGIHPYKKDDFLRSKKLFGSKRKIIRNKIDLFKAIFKLDSLLFLRIKQIFIDLLNLKNKNNDSIEKTYLNSIEWLCKSQDKTFDGGSSMHFNLNKGWGKSYVETTGYIIETLFDASKFFKDKDYKKRAIKMGEFLLNVQYNDGSFRSGKLAKNLPGVVFNTGQDLFGLCRCYLETKNKKYLDAAIKAGDWLIKVQEKNGSWKHNTFLLREHSYNTRTAWALLKLYRITNESKYKDSAEKNINYILNNKYLNNSWIKNNSFDEESPFLHTIAYCIRGLLESGIILKDKNIINSAEKSADKLMEIFNKYNKLHTQYENWKPIGLSRCLTGEAQTSIIWSKLYKLTNNSKYQEAASKINNQIKETQNIKNNNLIGAVKGSHPIWGFYQDLTYPNWATKFYADALLLEIQNKD